MISAASVAFVVPTANAQTQTDRLGFWLQEGDISNCTWQGGYQQCGATHPAELFFNSMFLTPPYPSSIEVMIFSINQAKSNNQGCSTTSGYVGSAITFWGDLAQLAESYPGIRLIYEISFDSSNGGSGPYGLTCFNSMVQAFGHYSSVYGLGVEGEYTVPQTTALYVSAQSYVYSVGKQFINYYAKVTLPAGSYDIYHTNFPAAGDQVGSLKGGGPNSIGIDSGYYYSFPFPQNLITCPIGANVVVTGVVEGWNQCVVSTELSTAVSTPSTHRQFVELDPGFSSSGSFKGISGQTTNQLWDNPTLRNWIWTDPNYQPNFILSTSSTSPPTTTSARSTTTTTRTSLTTTSSSTTPPAIGPQLLVLPTGVPYNPLNAQTLRYSIKGGPPGLDYTVKISSPNGNIQAIAAGTVDANGLASGIMSYIFNVQNGIFDAKASFANGASSNPVGIRVGSSTSASATTTYVSPRISSTVTSTLSSSTPSTSASSQQTTTRVTTTSIANPPHATTSITTSENVVGGYRPLSRQWRSIPEAAVAQTNATTASNGRNNLLEQGSRFSSPFGSTTGFVLGLTAGVALAIVILATVGMKIGKFSLRTSHQRGRRKGTSKIRAKVASSSMDQRLGPRLNALRRKWITRLRNMD